MRLSSILALIAALFIAVLAHSSTARAECGDYMFAHLRSTAGVSEKEAQLPAKLDRVQPVRPEQPCHGPHCSRGVPSPVVPTTTTVTLTFDWACLLASDWILEAKTFQDSSEQFKLCPHHWPGGIYHPPRYL